MSEEHPLVLDEMGKRNFFEFVSNQFVVPEIERRQSAGVLPENFELRECLILLPKNRPPIVLLNSEVHWNVKPQLAPDSELVTDRRFYNYEIVHVGEVLPPHVDGVAVAFVYLSWGGFDYRVVYYFSPNSPDFDPNSDFSLGKAIADILQHKLIELSVVYSENVQTQLRSIGLWPVTALLPYPMSRIVKEVGEGNFAEARQVLVECCNPQFITDLVETWRAVSVFEHRMTAFREAALVHKSRYFIASIHILIPHIEGVISDWLYAILKPEDVRFRAESKLQQFEQLIKSIPQFIYSYRRAFESMCEFMREGPVFQTFERWLDKIDSSFPGRHPVSHGRYEEELFTEENSIKLFLLLDMICQFMIFYEACFGTSRNEDVSRPDQSS